MKKGKDRVDSRAARSPREAGSLIPPTLRRETARLLDLQMWCWGQDIRAEGRNGLIAFGFERHAVRPGDRGSNAYLRTFDDGAVLALWGSGLLYGVEGRGGVTLGRFDAAPRFRSAHAPSPDELAGGHVPAPPFPDGPEQDITAITLVEEALARIAEYERWARDGLGPDHRRRCVAAWKKSRFQADALADAWSDLADRWGRVGDTFRSEP